MHGLQLLLGELYERYTAQRRLLDRLTRISDRFQRAERDRGLSYMDRYERKVRRIEKIVRISDRYQLMLRELNARLQQISAQDDLTGLPNRRFMQEQLAQQIADAERNGTLFSIALVDIDRFKAINDRYGHAVGDEVLVRVAASLKLAIRESDVCARWGGEEFLMLFPGCSLVDAEKLSERIRASVASVPIRATPAEGISVSIGVAEYVRGESLDTALRRADEALYRAKEAGRNRVVAAILR